METLTVPMALQTHTPTALPSFTAATAPTWANSAQTRTTRSRYRTPSADMAAPILRPAYTTSLGCTGADTAPSAPTTHSAIRDPSSSPTGSGRQPGQRTDHEDVGRQVGKAMWQEDTVSRSSRGGNSGLADGATRRGAIQRIPV
jgi:hypothetical protein